jgi:hypothetical protein
MLDRPLRYRAGGKVGKRCYVAGVAVSFYNRDKGRHSTSHGSDENKPPVSVPHHPAMTSNADSPGRGVNRWQFVLFAAVNRKICIPRAGKIPQAQAFSGLTPAIFCRRRKFQRHHGS